VLGLHYQRAQRHAEAWHYGRIAGDAAANAYANTEAAVHYERSLESARRLPEVSKRERAAVWVQLGDVRERLGRFDLALEAYRRAARLVVGDAVHAASMSLKRARARERSGAYRAALAEITTGLRKLDAAPSSDASLGARLLVFRAVVRQAQSRKAEALVVAQQAAEAAIAVGDDLALAEAYRVMDWAHQELGQADWEGMGERALRIYEALDHLEGQGKMMISLGAAAYYRNAWDEARDWYERARVMFLRSGNHVQAAISTMNIGELLVDEHRHDEADETLREAIRVFQASDFRDGQALAETYLGRSLLDRGDLDGAEQVLRRSRQGFEAVGVAGGVLEASVHLADCRVRQGHPLDALRLLDEAVSRVDGETGVLTASVARVQAAALAAIGRSAASAERAVDRRDELGTQI
jgi:tetratricopeptide (TPR) repeat protein